MRHAKALLRRCSSLALAVALVLSLALPGAAAAHTGNGHGHAFGHEPPGPGGHGRGKTVDVMTRNLYLGADLAPAMAASSPAELESANGQILREVVANDFPTRAKGLAQEILGARPDLVGLQEVALWQTKPLSPGAASISYDYLELLLDQLNAGRGRNGHGKPQYRVVAVQPEFDLESPADYNGQAGDGPLPGFPDAELVGHLTMRDVILARRGAGVRTWDESGGNFEHLMQVSILGNPIAIKRGWTATDAKVRGSHPFRFVNTHLEAFHPIVRKEQAEELVAPEGPATSSLPVVLVGDLNSDDDTVSGADRLAYQALQSAGMVERSTAEPLGCCLNSSLLAVGAGGSVSDFDHQVDHVMTRDPQVVGLRESTVTGLEPVNGFWDSDHAGLFSSLTFAP